MALSECRALLWYKESRSPIQEAGRDFPVGGTAMGVVSVAGFEGLVTVFFSVFTAPTAGVFLTLVRGWVLCLGRPTIWRLYRVAGVTLASLWACARFFRAARWELAELWRRLVVEVLMPWFAPTGRLLVAGDDTTNDKFGKRVAFAALFRDAVHSTGSRAVFHRAHCWVVLTLQVRLPGCKHVLSLPVNARIYRKEKDCDEKHPFRTRQQLLRHMAREFASWVPGRVVELVADGAYACADVAGNLPPQGVFTTRPRSDAVLYALPRKPRKPGRGRPRQRGKRLLTPARMAKRLRTWKLVKVVMYGEERERLVWTRQVLWWNVLRAVPVLLVISRDPEGKEKDDFFITTDVEGDAAHVVETYASRWGIEEVFREGKQLVGFGKVQGWRPRSVERQAPFALFVLSLVKAWYVHEVALRGRLEELPPTSAMLTALRMAYWRQRISRMSLSRREKCQILGALQTALSTAA